MNLKTISITRYVTHSEKAYLPPCAVQITHRGIVDPRHFFPAENCKDKICQNLEKELSTRKKKV